MFSHKIKKRFDTCARPTNDMTGTTNIFYAAADAGDRNGTMTRPSRRRRRGDAVWMSELPQTRRRCRRLSAFCKTKKT
jgi:hypothetical protein